MYKEILGDVPADFLQEKVEYPGAKNVKNVKKSDIFGIFCPYMGIWGHGVRAGGHESVQTCRRSTGVIQGPVL